MTKMKIMSSKNIFRPKSVVVSRSKGSAKEENADAPASAHWWRGIRLSGTRCCRKMRFREFNFDRLFLSFAPQEGVEER